MTVFAQTTETLDKNEIGLVIGATETPSIGEPSGGSIKLNSSIALGAEYDRKVLGQHTTLLIGADSRVPGRRECQRSGASRKP